MTRLDQALVEHGICESREKAKRAIMAGQVKAFKPSELKAMAQYIGSLPGDLKTVPQSKFR